MPAIATNAPLLYAAELMQDYANTARINAGTEYTKEATQAAILDTMMKKKAFESQQQFQTAMQQKMAAENAAEGMGQLAGKDLASSDPDTKSIADSPQQADPITRQITAVRKEQAAAKSDYQMAIAYGVDAKSAQQRMEKSQEQLGKLVLEQQKETVRKQQQAAQSLGAVEDAASLKESMDLIKDIDPKLARQLEQKLPHDADGGLVWNDAAKKVLAPVYSQFITGYQQGELKAKGVDQQLRAESIERERERDKETANYHDKEIAVRRAGIAAANQRHKDTLEAAGLKVDTKTLGDFSRQVENVSKEYQLPQYQHSNDVATKIESKLMDPKQGYEAVSTANARQLVDQFKLSADNYRRQGGGKYTEAQINKMNSTLDKLEKFTTTIGEGDKLLAKDVMLSTARSIKDLYVDQSVQVAKKELRLADTLKRRGQDPTLINYNADIPALERAGAAKTVTVDGKKYVAFGKEKSDIFELPSPPERPKILPIENTAE